MKVPVRSNTFSIFISLFCYRLQLFSFLLYSARTNFTIHIQSIFILTQTALYHYLSTDLSSLHQFFYNFRHHTQNGIRNPYLTRGNRYYIEFLVRELDLTDHGQVEVQVPGVDSFRPITNRYLERYE